MKEKKPQKPREAKYRGTDILDPVLGELISRAIGSAFLSKQGNYKTKQTELDRIIKTLKKHKNPEKILAALERAGLDSLIFDGGKNED